MNRLEFERFVAIDWSGGETERQAGIQVAQISRETRRLQVVRPANGTSWSRRDVLNFLGSPTDRRTLVGLDFAFSVPWDKGAGRLPACLAGLRVVRDLWAFIDHFCKGAMHLYAGPVWLSGESPFRPFIKLWSNALNYEREVAGACLLRRTEKAAAGNGVRPMSIYRMAGPQVGAGSFAGMRLLHALTSAQRADIAIWPFDRIEGAKTVIVEIYPALFYAGAGRKRPTRAQMKSGAHRKIVGDTLRRFGSHCDGDIPESIDAMDALVSAAAMGFWSRQADAFSTPSDADIRAREGWIFGVPLGGAP